MKEIELSKPIAEMDEDDLRTTFAKVMEAHEENVSEFSALTEELEAAQVDAEEAQDTLGSAKTYFAEKASGYTRLSGEVLAERFSLDELIDMAGQADEAEFADDGTDVDPDGDADADVDADVDPDGDGDGDADYSDDEETPLFAEKPQKSPAFTEDEHESIRAEAQARLSGLPGLSFD